MNAVGLKAELELAAYLRGLDWPTLPPLVPTVLESYSRGAQSGIDPEERDQMPPFPYITVRATDSRAVDADVDVHEVTMDVSLKTSADDEDMADTFTLLQIMEAGLQALTYGDGWALLNQAVDGSTPGFDCQFGLPGNYSGMNVENRARVFSRSISLFCRVVMPS